LIAGPTCRRNRTVGSSAVFRGGDERPGGGGLPWSSPACASSFWAAPSTRDGSRWRNFAGAEALAGHLRREAVDLLVDATHPFAARISRAAVAAATDTRTPLVRLVPVPWIPVAGDRWTSVPDLDAAAAALPAEPSCVFLTVGRLGLDAFEAAPQHHYIVRSIDPPDALALPDHRLLRERGPFDEASQAALMAAEHVDVMVTKNTGGEETYGKVAAARALSLPVIMVEPPVLPPAPTFAEPEAVLAEIERRAAIRLGGAEQS
jgi:precorrin-6A/cobalt-precorrin-6A reductase